MSAAGRGRATPPWWALLPPAEAQVSCGDGTHRLRWEQGSLTAVDHPGADSELVLAALGGDRSECVDLLEWWGKHGDDLEVLAVGPRSASDELTVTPESAAEFGAGQGGWVAYGPPGRGRIMALRTGRMVAFRPGRPRGPRRHPGLPSHGPMLSAMLRPRGPIPRPPAASMSSSLRRPPWMQQFRGQMRRQSERRTELFSLLALGREFQLRLAATVAAAWADGGSRAADRDSGRPALVAALAGRLAPAAQAWLGVDPDRVDVSLHESEGWGRLALSGTGRDRRLSAALPADWLASVWAAGLAVTDGHLVIAVTSAAWPDATVLGVPEPGADPVILEVRDGAVASTGWTLAAAGDERNGAP